jgi:transposase
MAAPLISDALWNLIEPFLPTPAPKPQVQSLLTDSFLSVHLLRSAEPSICTLE